MARLRLPLTIEEPTGVQRQNWPVRRGVPFPREVLDSPDHVRLIGPGGDEHPCEVEEAARWPDGSVKWILLDFPVALDAQATDTYHLEYGDGVARAPLFSELEVRESSAAIHVHTGPLAFTVNRESFSLLEQVQLHGRPLLQSQRLWVTDGGGMSFDLSRSAFLEVVVEEQTSRRIVIRARGRHGSEDGRTFLDYLVRVYAWADLPWVQIEYTFINTEDSERVDIGEIALETRLSLEGSATGMCGSGRKTYLSDQPFYFHHDSLLERYGVFAGSPVHGSDGEKVEGVGMYERQIARGWLDVSDGHAGVCVALRDFLALYPKEASWCDDRITFSIWPARAEALRLHQGMARTHTFMLYFHEGDGQQARAGELAAAFGDPLLPHNGPWYLESGAFGQVFPFSPERFPGLERGLRDQVTQARDSLSQGMLDYGDFVNPGTGSQGGFSTNNEPDRLHGFILQHLRSGERIPWQLAEAIAWHVVDVDVVDHTTRSDLELGGQRIHGHGHLQYDAEGYPQVSTVPSHMWPEGLLEYHYLTGHPHMRETAVRIGECFLKMVRAGWCRPPYHSNWHSVRDSGWPLIGMSAVYEATGDTQYCHAMHGIFEALSHTQGEDGSRPIELLYHTGYCPFQIAVCLTGLARYHEACGSEEVRDVFLKGMQFLAGDAMRFPDGAWTYVTTPDYRMTYRSASPLEPFGYAYQLTGDRGLIEQALRGWTGELDLRASLRFLWAAHAAGLLEDAI